MKTLTTLFLTALSSIMLAQTIPNADFENWTSGSPNGWGTTQYANGVEQSTTAEHGSYSVQFNSIDVGGGFYFGGQIASVRLPGDAYYANAGNPIALNGWYQLTSVGGDELTIIANTKCGTKVNGAALISYTTSTGTVWKQFSACFFYDTTCTADSIEILLGLENGGGNTHSGTSALIDNLSFGSCTPTGVDNINSNVTLESAYPNPANDICNIIYSIPASSTVHVALYDLSGRRVLNILDNTNQTPGRYKIPVDVTKLANGVYAYTITVNGVPYTQKLVVAK